MSWFSTQYDKVLLGVGGLAAVGLLYFGWSQKKNADNDFSSELKGKGKDTTAVEGAERIDFAAQSMELDHGWRQGDFEDRPVDLFTGIPLFIQRDTRKAVDLLKGPEVHPGIPNIFWLEYGVDPGFADSPQRDEDGDGFTNREEYVDGSHPMDPKDHPPLIKKLKYVGDQTVSWLLKPSFVGQDGAVPMTYEDTAGQRNRAGAADPLQPNKLFFTAGAAQGRFKFLDHKVIEEKNPATGIVDQVTLVRIEDQKLNKAGKIYEIPAPLRAGDRAGFIQHDRSAVLELKAVGAEGKDIVVEENTSFSLPDGGKKKEYHLVSVTPQSIVVEYPGEDGQRATVEIQKGAMPRLP